MPRSYPADMLAGLLAAAVALGAGELASGITGGASLIVEVGDVIVDHAPGSVVKAAIDALGTKDKPFLLASVTVISLALGALLGPVAGRWGSVGLAAFAIFAAAGGAAAARDPLTGTEIAIFVALVAGVAGYLTLLILLAAATPASEPVLADDQPPTPGRGLADRRRFLGFAAGAAGGAALAAFTGRGILGPAVDVEAQREAVTLPPPELVVGTNGFEVEDISPLITPNEDFYRIDTALVVPRVETADWRLSFTGLVDHPFELTFDELLELATLEETVTLACVSNEVGDDLIGTAVWRGVPLAGLLERAGVQPGGTQVVGRSVDNFTTGFPTDVALDGRPAMVAIGMNGEPLPATHGFPARLVVPGLYGYVSATKWLKEIELTGFFEYDAYWIPRGWSKLAPIKTQSRIDTPRKRRTVDPGRLPIAGVAWGGIRSIERVEVRVTPRGEDAAESEWNEAELGEALSQSTWRQWVLHWQATPGEYLIEVRATDGEGVTQTEQRQRPAPDGATGYHGVAIAVREASSLADPNSLPDPQLALDAARALWAVNGGSDYDFTFNWRCFCAPEYVERVDLEVREGAVVAGVSSEERTRLGVERLAEYPTVDGMFTLIQEAIDRDAVEIAATYAPAGHPIDALIDYAERLADDERGLTVHSLTVR